MTIEAYLFFNGRCDEAIEFYSRTLGAQATYLMRYRESPEPPVPGMLPPGFEDKVMHANLKIGDTTLMVSDGNSDAGPQFKGFSLTLSLSDEEAVRRAFSALAEDGQVIMPLSKTFWSPCFGMLSDRFGLGWMLMVYQGHD
jgi:PhnB protein